MPDASAGQNVVAQAQELGADVLARLDEITRQTEASTGVDLEQRKKLAQEAVDKMKAIVEEFIAATNEKNTATQEVQAASDAAEIERLKASVQ